MDNKYLDNVILEMQPFFDENGFNALGECVYANEIKKVEISYDEARQMFLLNVADKAEEGSDYGEFREINAWLFDDSQNAKDAVAVGIDFVVSLKKELGIKSKRTPVDTVDLPTATKTGNMTVSGFTKKMLDVFPALKSEYKAHVAKYGNFLYLNFFGEHLVPILNNLFSNGTKKQIKKFYDVLEDAYVKGDKDTVNTVVSLLCAASYENESNTQVICEMLGDNQHFLLSYNNFKPVFAKNKKLISAYIK